MSYDLKRNLGLRPVNRPSVGQPIRGSPNSDERFF